MELNDNLVLITCKILPLLNLLSHGIKLPNSAYVVNALKIDTRLTRLLMSNNPIENEGVAYIADLLLVNYTLRYFNLKNSNIGPQGAISITNALKTNKFLKSLDLTKIIWIFKVTLQL